MTFFMSSTCVNQSPPPSPVQVVTSIGELVEVCSAQIQSGWRPLFSALETVHSGDKSEVKEYLVGDYSMGKNSRVILTIAPSFLMPSLGLSKGQKEKHSVSYVCQQETTYS